MSKNMCVFRGKKYEVIARLEPKVKKITVVIEEDKVVIQSPKAGEIDITKALMRFYKKECKKIVSKRLKFYNESLRFKYRDVVIEDNDKRWGSCSSQRNLTFNWKLVLFPPAGLDYVVVHELCHLKHLNHDRSFWRLVGKVMPDYKEAMAIIGSEKTRDM